MRDFSAICFTALLVLFSHPLATAAEITDLYEAQVPAQSSQSQWQRAAFSAVLLKLTGSDIVLADPEIAAELKNSGSYVKQFQSIQVNAQPMMVVQLDAQKITALLQREQIPIWGSRRPDQLLWFSEKMQDKPQLVMDAEHPLRKALMAQAKIFGLSYVFPFYDVDDLTLINEQALWTGDWPAIQGASLRYQTNDIFNLLFDQFTDTSGTVTFRLTAQQWQDGQLQSREYIQQDAMKLAEDFSGDLAKNLAAKYAVVVNSAQTAQQALTITIEGVQNLRDLDRVQKIFNSLLTVRSQRLQQFRQGQAVFQVELAAQADDFYRSMQLVRQLRPETELAPELSAAELALDAQFAQASDEEILANSTANTGEEIAPVVNDGAAIQGETEAGATAADTTSLAELPISSDPAAQIHKTNRYTLLGS